MAGRRSAPEPFEGTHGTLIVHDRSTDRFLITADDGGEALVPVGDLWGFVEAVDAAEESRDATGPEKILGEVLEQPADRWAELLRSSEQVPTYDLAALALERSRVAAFSNPRAARVLADFARFIADEIEHATPGRPWLGQVRARVEACRGHALRLLGDLDGADAAFALAHQELATSDPEIDALEAPLRLDHREFRWAHACADRAIAGLLAYGHADRATCAVLVKAAAFITTGDLTAALQELVGALHLVDLEFHPAATLAVEAALGSLTERRPPVRRHLPSRPGPRAVPALAASYPTEVEVMDALSLFEVAVRRHDLARRMLGLLARGAPLREQTA